MSTAVATEPTRIKLPGINTPPKKASPALKTGLTDVVTADIGSWDTAFAVQVQYVNQAIAAANISPTQFTQTDSTMPATLSGTFGTWQISNGGSGELIEMTIPITTTQLTYGGNTETLSNLQAIILVNLTYVAQTSGPGNNLVIQPNTTNDPTVSVRNVVQAGTNQPADPNSLKQAIITALLTEWFNANVTDFTYVFNTVNLNQQIDTSWSWLVPTSVSYAFAADPGGNLNNSVFAVLCMTENRPAPSSEVSSGVIPAAAQAGFVISSSLYLQSLVLPGLPGMFVNATAADFFFDPAAAEIRNVADIQMSPVSMNGSDRETTIPEGEFSLTMAGSEIVIAIKQARLTYSPGIDIVISYTSYFQLALQPQTGGTQTIIYQSSTVPGHETPDVDHDVEVSTGVQIAEGVASLIAAGIGAAVGFGGPFASTAAKMIVAAIIAIALNAITNIPQWMAIVAGKKWDELPTIDLMLTNATDPVDWPGGSTFNPTVVEINTNFVLGGTMFTT
ncbi:MAG: TULIP family P47-like protein [Acidobacteria bacterium]|nr:TULIP family P47-like protein [Acidobacteriota bacterium]